MMTRTGALAVAALTVMAAHASGQTADDIVTKYIAARGGLEQLKSVQSIRMKGTMTSGPGQSAPVVIELKRPAMMRMDMTVEGTTGTQAFDGTSGWVFMPFAGMNGPERMPPDVVKEAQSQADFDGPLVDYAAKGNRIELAGKERTGGRDAWRLAVTLKNGSTRTVFIDASTFLEIKSVGTRAINGTTVESEAALGDYRKVDGIMFPFTMETGLTSMPQKQKMVLDTIEVNVAIGDERFRMPAR